MNKRKKENKYIIDCKLDWKWNSWCCL